MIHVQRTRRQKKTVLLIVFSVLFALLLGGYLIAKALTPDEPDDPTADTIDVDTALGEALYSGSPVAFSPVDSESIDQILINYKRRLSDGGYVSENYAFERSEKNVLLLYLPDESGNPELFAPEILSEDGDFDYTSLYAIEQNDGFGRIMKITYLCVAIGTPYFSERIALPTDAGERAETLASFGLTESKATLVKFGANRTEGGGYETTHKLVIGDAAVNGSGFYFLVDDRDYVYYTTSSYFAYADAPVETFIQPSLVSAGLSSDSAMEPYLTPDFRQYKNALHEDGTVEADADIVIHAIASSVISQGTKVNSSVTDSYQSDSVAIDYPISLSSSERLNAYFTGKAVGDYSQNPLYYTEYTDSKVIDFGDADSTSYVYTIVAVESAVTDTEEIRTQGASIPENAKLLVTYYAEKDGVSQNEFDPIVSGYPTASLPLHAVIDLADTRIDSAVRSALAGAAIGNLATPITLTKTYQTSDTDNVRTVGIRICEITAILDQNDYVAEVAEDGCRVRYSYYLTTDGKTSGELCYNSAEIGDTSDDFAAAVSNALKGKKALVAIDADIDAYVCHTEYLQNPTVYRITSIPYYVTSEQVVGFAFVNASDRDPYYGETFYTNTMDSSFSLYGVNTASCEAVVKKIGGIGTSSNSSASTSSGLFGTETVKVGLTPQVIKDYGLYAYTVHFALPRGISEITLEGDEDNDALGEYTFSDVLYFTLYVSEKMFDTETETYFRYAASDLYGAVVKIDADEFLFLDYDFLSFYARRSLIQMYIDDVEEIVVDFLMDDLQGSYVMDVQHNNRYYRAENGKLLTYAEKKYSLTDQNGNVSLYGSREDIVSALTAKYGYSQTDAETIAKNASALPVYDFINVFVTPSGVTTPTKFDEYLTEKGYTGASLYEFYLNAVNGGVKKMDSTGYDDVSTSYFKEIFNMIYSSFYAGRMSEDDQTALAASDPIFRLTLSVKDQTAKYIYEFYRTQDRRVSVKLTKQTTPTSSVSSFYVSSFTEKRFVSAFYALLMGEGYDSSEPYTD